MKDPSRQWLPLIVILVGAAILRLIGLGSENYWVDEVIQLGHGKAVGMEPLQTTSWLVSRFVLLFGDSEFLLRLPSVVFSVAEIGVLYVVARRLFSERVALITIVLLTISAMHVWYAQELRWYSQWSFLGTLSWLLLLKAFDSDRPKTYLGYAAVSVLNLYTFILTAPLLVTQAVAAVFRPRSTARDRIRFLLKFGLLQVAIVAVALPLIWTATQGAGSPTGTPRATTVAVFPYTIFAYLGGYSFGPTLTELHDLRPAIEVLQAYPEVLAYVVVFGTLIVAGTWRMLKGSWPERSVVLIWAAGMPTALFLIAILVGGTYNVRYTLPSLPALYLLLGVGADRLSKIGRMGWLGLGLATVGLVVSLRNYYVVPQYDKEDVRGALEYVKSTGGDGDPVLVAGQVGIVARYYSPLVSGNPVFGCDSSEEIFALDIKNPPPELPSEIANSEPVIWMLIGRDWAALAEPCRTRLAPGRVAAEEKSFTGVRLLKLVWDQ